jgi:hypothetical protein
VRGLARALVGLLQTGVDVTCRLGQLSARRHYGGPSSGDRSFGSARNDHHYAALGQLHTAESEWRHDRDTPAGEFEYAA